MIKKCKVCKDTFSVPKSHGRISTCSVVCGGLFRRRRKVKKCRNCKKEFWYRTSRLKAGKVLYCSQVCYGIANRDKSHYLWKGKQVSYGTMHRWVRSRLGSANHCVECGLNKIPEGKKKYFQWANISKKYLRKLSDYKSLCVPCHKHFDGYGLSEE